MSKFKGFSTKQSVFKKRFGLTDVELIKQDLLNMFNCRVTERLHRPNHGCKIWEILYDPLDNMTKEFVLEEIQRMINLDPRVKTQNILLEEFEHGIRVDVVLAINTLATTTTMRVFFDRNSHTAQLG